jgi:CRP-like cAMP-binding protein
LITLKRFIENYTKIPDAEWQIIQQAFERKEIKKNEFILEEGKICRYFYFLEEGLIRFFIIKNGEDISKIFTAAPNCFTSTTSFRSQKPSKEYIQALENSIVWQISFSQVNQLAELNSWNDFIRKFIHEVREFAEELLMEVRTETAETRYDKLMEKYPILVQKIPLKYLASFLGIAPQSLSRIRKKLNQNNRS